MRRGRAAVVTPMFHIFSENVSTSVAMKRFVDGIIALIFTACCFTGCSTPGNQDGSGDAGQEATEAVSSQDTGGGSATKPSGSGTR
jgi:hypothetical protein